MALETLKPQVPVDQDTDTVRGLEVLRNSGANAELTYDESVSEWTVNNDLSVDGNISGSSVTTNASGTASTPFEAKDGSGNSVMSAKFDVGTGLGKFIFWKFENPDNDEEVQVGLDQDDNNASLFYTDELSGSVSEYGWLKQGSNNLIVNFDTGDQFSVSRDGIVNLPNNNTQDTSGDLQIRNDSGGDLFSLNDGNNPPVVAKYEGNGAFTFGSRNDTVGAKSLVFGSDYLDPSKATGEGSIAIGDGVESTGQFSVSIGRITVASAKEAIAIGRSALAEAQGAVALGFITTSNGRFATAVGTETDAEGESSFAANEGALASGDSSASLGRETISRSFGGTVVGIWNEDYLGPGDQRTLFSNVTSSDRVFSVGVGDKPGETVGSTQYFDGRGRVDGLYVTMRDGTYARHGFQVDRWNGSSYERELRIPETIQSGTDTSEILVRNPNTNEVEFVSDVDVASGAVSVESGADTDVTFNSSTGAFTVDVVAEGTEGEFQIKDADTSLGAVDSGTTAAYDSANGAFTFGVRSGSVGVDSIALGGSADSSTSVIASGKASTAIGLNSEASALASFAAGTDTLASGDYAFAIGDGAEASGEGAFATAGSTASGFNSFATGNNTEATSINAFATGQSTVASAARSTAMGNQTVASGRHSMATGHLTEANGERSFAGGDHTIVETLGGAAFGLYNSLTDQNSSSNIRLLNASDKVFAIGAGDDPNSSPGFDGYFDGRGRLDAFYATYRNGSYVRHGFQVDRYDNGNYVRELRIPASISSGSNTSEVLVRNPNTNELEYVSAAQISSSGIDLSGGDNITTTFVASTGSTRIDAVASGSDGYVQVNDNGKFGVADSSDIAIRYHTNNAAFTAGARSGTVGANSVVLNGSNVQTNQASGSLSLAVGGDNIASGSRSFAAGNLTTASGSDTASLGQSTAAKGAASVAVGDTTEARPFASLAVGRYNTLDQTTNSSASGLSASSKMFAVGTGESGSREDSFYVTYGNGAHVKNGLTLLDAVPEEDVPDKILVRNTNTGRVEQTDPVDVVDTGIEVQGGDNITTSFNSSTGQTIVSVTGAGSTNDFQLNDGSGLGVVTGTPVARYEGSGAFTFGHRTGTASANSVVMSGEDGNENEASGDVSVALGRTTTASGDYAFVAGNNNTSSATASSALGQNSTASGNYSLALGRFALASGPSALAVGDQVDATGDQSVALGNSTTASSFRAVATGLSTTASGNNSTAMGFDTTASGTASTAIGSGTTASEDQSIALNSDTIASGFHAAALGFNVVSRVYGGSALGLYNEDNVGAGSEPSDISNLLDGNKIFAVGAGDDPSSSPGDNNYFDGRGRVDGFYVTMRDGAYARHGFQIDAWNGSSYEKTLRIGSSIPEGSGGEVLIRNPNTNDLEYIKADDLVAEGVNVSGGNNISTRYNSSTDEFIVDLDEDRLVERESITSGALQVQGDNRSIDYSLNQRTTTGTQAVMAVDSQGLNKLPSAQNDATWKFRGEVVARVEENTNSSLSNAFKGDSHVWELEGVFSTLLNNSTGINETRFIGSPAVSTISTDSSVSGYSVTVTATGGQLEVNVQAENGAKVNWTAKIEVVELVA